MFYRSVKSQTISKRFHRGFTTQHLSKLVVAVRLFVNSFLYHFNSTLELRGTTVPLIYSSAKKP